MENKGIPKTKKLILPSGKEVTIKETNEIDFEKLNPRGILSADLDYLQRMIELEGYLSPSYPCPNCGSPIPYFPNDFFFPKDKTDD